jgi:hypothetical protein
MTRRVGEEYESRACEYPSSYLGCKQIFVFFVA